MRPAKKKLVTARFQFRCHRFVTRAGAPAIVGSGGSASGNDCSGTFSFDFNAHIQSGLDPQLVAGEEVFRQYWSRDPASPSTTSLTDALGFLINP